MSSGPTQRVSRHRRAAALGHRQVLGDLLDVLQNTRLLQRFFDFHACLLDRESGKILASRFQQACIGTDDLHRRQAVSLGHLGTCLQILQQAGVPVNIEETMEPPLETWVSDDVDMPDADAAGPGQEGALVKAASSLQDMAHKEAMHEQELRRATANADAAERPS